MSRPITRRDFLNGVAVGVGGILAASHGMAAFDAQSSHPRKLPATILRLSLGCGATTTGLLLSHIGYGRRVVGQRRQPGENRGEL